MLVVLVPLFDENMAVSAYSIFTQKNNFFLNPFMLGTGQNDGASRIDGLELIQSMGMETLSDDKEVFVPITNISVFSDIAAQCNVAHSRLVLLIDNTIPPVEMYIQRLKVLKEQGYRLAIRKLPVAEYENYKQILELVDYVFLNNKKVAVSKAKIYFNKLYPSVKLCAGNIESVEIFEELRKEGGYALYEGIFYRTPLTKGQHQVSPLKTNYLELLKVVNAYDFELTKAADIIGRDTALTISLLKMVNRMAWNSEITSIRHAAAMLGQRELKKWINTAVVNAMYADKPNEVTRLSLLRAKFAEYLAPVFGLAMKADELFLMGLFSVLDVILETSMDEAVKMVGVADEIRDALVAKKGNLAPVMDFVIQYEGANWPEVSRQMALLNIDLDIVYQAYMKTLQWYKDLSAGF